MVNYIVNTNKDTKYTKSQLFTKHAIIQSLSVAELIITLFANNTLSLYWIHMVRLIIYLTIAKYKQK